MSFFRQSLKALKERQQVTHNPGVPGAAVPEAHTGVVAPEADLAIDQRGSDMPADPNIFGMTVRGRFRGNTRGVPTQADIAFDTTQDERAAVHHTGGARDKRATDEYERGNAIAGELGQETSPWTFTGAKAERLTNMREQPKLDRPRAGWQSDDGDHTAWTIRPVFNRPFDKNMTEHPTTEKVTQPAPVAMHATQTEDLAYAYPSPGGWRGTHTEGIPQLRQAIRRVPGLWGRDAVQQETVTAVVPSVRGGFR